MQVFSIQLEHGEEDSSGTYPLLSFFDDALEQVIPISLGL